MISLTCLEHIKCGGLLFTRLEGIIARRAGCHKTESLHPIDFGLVFASALITN